MSGLVRCDCCNGRKRVLGMGGMEKPCGPCKGIGWIKDETEMPVYTDGLITSGGNPVIVKRKPGRKPKIVKRKPGRKPKIQATLEV
jgi:phage FluMu protein Com